MSDYRDITSEDIKAFPALDSMLDRAAECAVRTELMQWLQRIIGGDYHDLAQNGVSCGRGDCCEFHLEKNQIFPSMDVLRQHAEDLYPDGYIPDIVGKNMVGEIRAIRVLFERTGKEWQSAPLR